MTESGDVRYWQKRALDAEANLQAIHANAAKLTGFSSATEAKGGSSKAWAEVKLQELRHAVIQMSILRDILARQPEAKIGEWDFRKLGKALAEVIEMAKEGEA